MDTALKVGISTETFWNMTPAETYMAIDAALWRDERQQKLDTALAWRIANLSRAKRIPSLKSLLSSAPAKPLRGEALERRRQEFKEMSAAVDVEKLTEALGRDRSKGVK